MPVSFIYLLKLSVSLAVVFMFYQFVLRRLTFFNWNRWYLLGYSLLSFFIAAINISPVIEKSEWANNGVMEWVPLIANYQAADTETVSSSSFFTIWNMAALLFISGMVLMAIRLIVQLISFGRMMRRARSIRAEGMNIYQVDEKIIPFSFGNSIFVNRHLHTETELEEIIRHEFVHVKQKHSVDIIISELICLLNWYNPFAWLIRKAIRQNLEFIADNKVLEYGIDRRQYQYLLLKVIGNNHFSIAQKFNFSSLKKRIAMMNKMKSAGVHVVKFLFVLPLVAVLLISFRTYQKKSAQEAAIAAPQVESVGQSKAVFTDTVPPKAKLNSKGYYVDIIDVSGNCTVVVKDKNKNEKTRLLLTEWDADKDRYEAQYGEIATTHAGKSAHKHPSLTNVSEFEFNGTNATMVLKDGTKEEYDLSKEEDKKKFESKYGKVIHGEGFGHAPVAVAGGVEVAEHTAPVVAIGSGHGTGVGVGHGVAGHPAPVAIASSHGSGHTVIAPMAPLPAEGVAVIAGDGHIVDGVEDILVTITNKTTKKELDELIAKMKEKNVTLSFENIEYDGDKLVSLSGTMKRDNSRSNFSVTDFSKLTLSVITHEGRTYFKVNTKDEKVVI